MAHTSFSRIRTAALGVAMATCPYACAQSAPTAPEEGLASWYGPSFNGLKAASGETYNEEQFTAAHRTLPFGTRVRVRRLDSDESIVVRINDRGPYVESRIIDLSFAAARTLGMTEPGLIPVSVEVVDRTAGIPERGLPYAVQVGTFRNPENARRTREAMEAKFGTARIVPAGASGELSRVLVGAAATEGDAEALAGKVRASDRAFQSAYVVRVGAAN